MKKNSTMRLAALLLVLTLVTSCFVGGTFAKYTATGTVEGTSATVAKWGFEVGGADIAASETVAIDLFSTTVYEEDGETDETDVNGNKIAPGTGGSFEIAVENTSEVNAKYSLALSITNTNNIPLQFSTDGGNTWKTNIADLNVTDKEIAYNDNDSVTVNWMWDFDSAETIDNPLGLAGTANVTVKATVTAEQVD